MLEWIFRGTLAVVLGWVSFILALIGIQINRLLTTEQGPFTVVIERQAATDRDEALIAAAEALCPTMPPYPEVLTPVGSSGDCDWWHREHSGFRVPLAVTGDAWRYYQDEVGKMQQEAESHDYDRVTSARLNYTATVHTREDAGEDLRNWVELTLNWYYYCGGGFCAHSFGMKRVVYFDSAGNPTFVVGDGEADIRVP